MVAEDGLGLRRGCVLGRLGAQVATEPVEHALPSPRVLDGCLAGTEPVVPDGDVRPLLRRR